LEFAAALRDITSIEVVMVDERLSTVSASKKLRESGKSAKEAKGSIDMAAAVGILEFAIDLEKKK
jgi:putative holliday junction resolvase